MSDDPIDPTLRRPCPLPRGTIRRGGAFCGTCGEVVHDLSTVSRAEARALLGRGEVRCVRFERGADGRVLHNLAVATVVTALAGCAAHQGGPNAGLFQPTAVPQQVVATPGPPGLIEVQVYDPDGLEMLLAEVSVDGAAAVRALDNGLVVFAAPDGATHHVTVRFQDQVVTFEATGGTRTNVTLLWEEAFVGLY